MFKKSAAICAAICAAEAPAHASDWQVGIGLRETSHEAGALIGDRFEGGRVIGRADFGAVAMEAQLYGALSGTNPASSLDIALLEIAAPTGDTGFHIQREEDLLTATLLADWGFGEWADEAFSGGPRLYLGAEARRHQLYTLRYDEALDVTEEGARWAFGPVIGVGWHAWLGRAGVRLALYDRMSIAPPLTWSDDEEPDGLELRHAPTVGLDVLIRFGGAR